MLTTPTQDLVAQLRGASVVLKRLATAGTIASKSPDHDVGEVRAQLQYAVDVLDSAVLQLDTPTPSPATQGG